MRIFPDDFKTELSRPGCTPYWLLILVANGVTYYLSDNDRAIASLGATAYGVVSKCDSLREGSGNGVLAGYSVAEYTLSLFCNLPISGGGTTIAQLMDAGYLDEAQADLYLGLAGIATPPQLIHPGYIRDFGTRTDVELPLVIQDRTILLENSYVGRKVTTAAYPQAAKSDIGKVIPIPFGTISKVPALLLSGAVTTTLKTACAAGDGSLYLSDLSRITIGMTLLLESEQVYVSGVGTYTVTVTRAYNSTTAVAHAKAVAVVQLADQVYVAADRPISSLTKAWLRLSDELDLDITGSVNLYSGQTGNALAGYAGMGAVLLTAANMASIAALATLALNDGIGVNTGNHTHTAQTTKTQVANDIGTTYGGPTYSSVTAYPGFVATQNIVEQTCSYAFGYGGDSSARSVYVAGVLIESGVSANSRIEWTGTTVGQPAIYVTGGMGTWVKILSGTSRSVTYLADTTSSPATGVAKTGTVTLTGGDVTNYFSAGKLFVDVASDNGSPAGIANWLLTQRGLPNIQTTGVLTANAFNGLIAEYQTYLYWLNKLAFEAGAWFVMPTGQPRFIGRQKTVPVATITECLAGENGITSLTATRTALEDKLEIVTVLYARDWIQSKGDTAYTGATAAAGSGTRERPDLFQFDFITDAATAINLRDLYLSLQSSRHALKTFDAWIDQAALETGDTVTLWTGETGIIYPAEIAPGSYSQADTVKITILI